MAIILLLAACGGGAGDASDQGQTPSIPEAPSDEQVMRIGDRVFSIPSPAQTALAIREAGLPYRKDLPLPLESASTSAGKTNQATLLGMLGADLAYVTVHQDGQRAMATLQAIEKVGNQLDLGNAFDKSLLDGFKKNLGNEDSLLLFSGTAFRAADRYLKENDRDDVGVLVLAGGWIESLHLVLNDAEAVNVRTLVHRIGDQRGTLDGLVALLEKQADVDAEGLLKGLRGLQGQFSGIKRAYTYEEPVTDASARTTYINSKSSVEIPPATIDAIREQVNALRAQIIA
ncbi:MAG: hypothetical protein KIT10_15705 [Flavobacteriales bacterium]|nr:hypothetical protein [Flavobacteriales bacterium]